MADNRTAITDAGIEVLRERGLGGFTQPRVAAKAGLRQSHLTYYYPTRVDLLAAVGEAVVERQLAAVGVALASVTSPQQAVAIIAHLVIQRDNTRVLLALAQFGDEEPRLRTYFRALADGIVARVEPLFDRLGIEAQPEHAARMLHALSVGLAVIDLAADWPEGRERAADVVTAALAAIMVEPASRVPLPRSTRGEPQ